MTDSTQAPDAAKQPGAVNETMPDPAAAAGESAPDSQGDSPAADAAPAAATLAAKAAKVRRAPRSPELTCGTDISVDLVPQQPAPPTAPRASSDPEQMIDDSTARWAAPPARVEPADPPAGAVVRPGIRHRRQHPPAVTRDCRQTTEAQDGRSPRTAPGRAWEHSTERLSPRGARLGAGRVTSRLSSFCRTAGLASMPLESLRRSSQDIGGRDLWRWAGSSTATESRPSCCALCIRRHRHTGSTSARRGTAPVDADVRAVWTFGRALPVDAIARPCAAACCLSVATAVRG